MNRSFLILMSGVFALSACSTLRGSRSGDGAGFQLREFQEERLGNGLQVLWIQDQTLPRVSYNLLIKSGAIDDQAGQQGLMSMTAALLDQGTAKRTAPQLAEDLAQIGADFSQATGYDAVNLGASGLSQYKSEVLDLFAEIVMTPGFNDKELERLRSVSLAVIQKSKDQPSVVADQHLDQQVFGAHPYAFPTIGDAKAVKALKRDDVVRQYKTYFRPNNAILSVVGQYDEGFKERVRKAFEKWQPAEVKPTTRKAAQNGAREILLVHKPGLQQTQLRWGHLGIERKNPDFLAFRMANVILGGAFASRLNQKIRDDLGLTYSISSSSDARLEPGSFEVSTFTRHDKAVLTVLETEKVLRDFIAQGVNDAEIEAAKALLIGQFPAAVETADRTAANLMSLRLYGISDSYLQNFQRNVREITKDQVNAAIRKYVHPDRMQLVIYSDEKMISTDLEKLGAIRRVNFQ